LNDKVFKYASNSRVKLKFPAYSGLLAGNAVPLAYCFSTFRGIVVHPYHHVSEDLNCGQTPPCLPSWHAEGRLTRSGLGLR